EAGFAPWTAGAFAELVERELRVTPGRSASGFPLTAVVLGGAIPMPSALQLIAPLALGSPVIARPGSHDLVTARAVKDALAALDAALGACLEVVAFPHADRDAMEALAAADCVVATGSDAAVAAIRALTQPWQRFVGYGHRFSVAALGRDAPLSEACAAAARDVSLWDQLGCLSPIALYAVGWRWEERALLLDALAAALEELRKRWPAGRVSTEARARRADELATCELRAAATGDVELRRGAGGAWALLAERDPAFRGSSLHRTLRVHFVEDLDGMCANLAPVARHLASAGIAGFSSAEPELRSRLAELGASRICPAGAMQAPPISWCNDGQGVLLPLARLSDRAEK
ncbi:MAG TPA: acyl-CoA reductase, partial [Myxococcota bacterium]|nr:acyl-CoA reductase [Myxococcota bacterium]